MNNFNISKNRKKSLTHTLAYLQNKNKSCMIFLKGIFLFTVKKVWRGIAHDRGDNGHRDGFFERLRRGAEGFSPSSGRSARLS